MEYFLHAVAGQSGKALAAVGEGLGGILDASTPLETVALSLGDSAAQLDAGHDLAVGGLAYSGGDGLQFAAAQLRETR